MVKATENRKLIVSSRSLKTGFLAIGHRSLFNFGEAFIIVVL